jgi:ADP-ribose pyrophosphatase YjhB (NUDIX family)
MIAGPINYCPRCGTSLIEQLHSGKLRPVCPGCKWVYFPDPKVAALVLIKNDDLVLLIQRRFEPHKGLWTLPSGFVDAGEDPMITAKRECLEETGLVIHNIKILDVIYSQESPNGASILILYQAQVQSGMLKPGDDAEQAAYFDTHGLPQLAFSSTQQILDLYI